MNAWRTRPRWAKGTYMKLRSSDMLKAYVLTGQDLAALKAGRHVGKVISQRELADRAGVHPSFINHLTSGRRTSCTPEVAVRIAEAVGSPLEILFEPKMLSETTHSMQCKAA